MTKFLTGLLFLSALVLLAGFAGRFHGAGDSISLARPLLVPTTAILALILFIAGRRLAGLAGFVMAAFAGSTMLPPPTVSQASAAATVYSAYQKNLLWILPSIEPVALDIETVGADFVMLQEVHRRNRAILSRLNETYPYQHFCPFAAVGGIAVLSRWAPTQAQPHCNNGDGFAAMQVNTPSGPLWIVSLHLHWPYPYRQTEQLEKLLPVLDQLDGDVVLGGDFNMVPWSRSVAAVARATRTQRAGYAGGTFTFSYEHNGADLARWIPSIPIDHLLIPQSGTTFGQERRGLLGSDHNGIVARFAIDDA